MIEPNTTRSVARWSADELNEIAQRAIARGGADDTQVTIRGKASELTRFANNQIHQNVSERDLIITVRVALGQKVGQASTNDLSDAAIARAVANARELARLQPDDPGFPGFAQPQTIASLDAASRRSLAFEPADRALVVGHVCRDAAREGLTAAGSFETGVHQLAIANSHGLFAFHEHTLAEFTTVVMSDDSSGWAADTCLDASQIDGAALAEEAIEKALRSRHPETIEPGLYTVILEEYAALDLLMYLGAGFGADVVREGRSFTTGRQGELVLHPDISIWDDGHDLTGIPAPFDAEGMPRQRVELITRGRIADSVYDMHNAKVEGRASTGHHVAAGAFSDAGVQAINLFMSPGSHTKDELLESTERGIWVTRFHYCNRLDARKTTLTGMTRDGTFLIENGKLTRPLKNMRFTHPITDALRDVEMIGLNTKLEQNWYGGGNRAPALKINNFRFTGKTNF